jgi:hypothetical protein
MALSFGPAPFRLALICAIALGLAPGTLLRTNYDQRPQDIAITLTPLSEREGIRGELAITGAWELSASSPFFGGFSALVNSGANTETGALLAGSDKGWTLDIPLVSGEPVQAGMEFIYFATRRNSFREMIDLEAMARDPETGTLWTAYEGFNAVQRDRIDGESARSAPTQMRGWSANSGPEAMARLMDGRFIILAEGPGWIAEAASEGSGRERAEQTTRPGLLFASDPIEASTATAFRVSTPPNYSPVDATALPDGSVLILLRRLQISIPATFDAAIMRADPGDIEEGGEWTGEIIAKLEGPLFGENFEGIAYVPNAGSGAVYLISDDNLSMFQRSLLVRLEWPQAPGP